MDYQPLTPPSGSTNSSPTPASLPTSPNISLPKDLGSLGSFGTGKSSSGPGPLMLILVVLLALGTVGFGLMALAEAGTASRDQNNLVKDENLAASAAASTQKKTDAKNESAANESPFRSYVAPVTDGSFQINFPKDWSSWVDSEQSGTLIDLIMNPDSVTQTNGQPDLAAAKVELIDQDSTDYLQQFSGNVQSGQLQKQNTTISGIASFNLTGDFGDQRTTREVVVPVRDQVVVFVNENGEYASEFNEILAQAKINP